MKRGLILALVAAALVIAIEFVLWAVVARHRLDGYAWSALVRAHVHEVSEVYKPLCVSVEPRLFASTPPRLQRKAQEALQGRGVQLRVAEPTHSPETGGYLDRECVEYLIPPPELAGFNLPLLSRAVIEYYGYDSNGDEVVMLQVGTHWLYLWHKSVWI